MKALTEICSFWSALPGAAYFGNVYQDQIGAVEVAAAGVRLAEDAARMTRGNHSRALTATS